MRVRDIARVELGGKTYTYDSKFNGEPSSSIAIYQLPGANAMTTAAAIRAKMKELSQQASEKVQAEMAQKQQANAQQNNNSTIAQFLAP